MQPKVKRFFGVTPKSKTLARTDVNILVTRGFNVATFALENPQVKNPGDMLAIANAIAENTVHCALDESGKWPDAILALCKQIAVEQAQGAGAILTTESVDGYSYALSNTDTSLASWQEKLELAAGCNDTAVLSIPYDTCKCT